MVGYALIVQVIKKITKKNPRSLTATNSNQDDEFKHRTGNLF